MWGSLQHWTEPSIIPNSREVSVWRNKKHPERTAFFAEDGLLTWSTRTSGSLEPMIPSRIMPMYLQLFFEMMIFRNSIQWMTKILSDDILDGLYKLRIRGSGKLKTVLELYYLETHQKKLGPDYHRLKTMEKRSIEQEFRNKYFGARSGNFEKNAVVKNQGTKQRVQRILGDCWQWETNGQCVKVSATIWISVEKVHQQIRLRILSCSRMSENHRRPEVPGEEVPVVECLDGLARITSKELAITHSVKDGTLQNACSTRPRVVVGLGKSAHSHTVRLMNSRRKGPKRMVTKVQWLCWRRDGFDSCG